MARKPTLNKEILQKVRAYLNLLEKRGFNIEKAIVFGSYAKGEPKPWSDIDVCLVSKQFGKDIFEEGVAMSRLAGQVDPLIEPHPLHTTDFKEKYHPLASEVKKYGIVVS